MNGSARWFESVPDPQDNAGSGPRLLVEPAGLLLIPGPAAGLARGVATGFAPREIPGRLSTVTVEADRPRSLRDIRVVQETAVRGSITLSSFAADAPATPMPRPRLDEPGGGSGGYRPWPISGDDVPLSRRLSHLLQPALDLLLDRRGPLDWPHPLFPYQLVGVRELVARDALLLADDMGLGKAQPLDSKLLTPNGWVRMGEIRVGSEVVGSDGDSTKVIEVYPQGEKEVFRVTFSDGSSTECCDDHLWVVRDNNCRARGQPGKAIPLREIRARLFDKAGNARHFIPMTAPVAFQDRDLPLDPYLLGALLGDGGFAHGYVRISSIDELLIRRVSEALPQGVQIAKVSDIDWKIISPGRGIPNPVIRALKSLGLMGHRAESKFIPWIYRFAPVQARIDLLHGLMDTDGHVRPKDNNVEFCTVSRQLAEDVVFLVQSLGGRATIRLHPTKARLAYRMSVILPFPHCPFWLPRKASTYRQRAKYQPSRAIVAVEPLGIKPCQCIAVDAPDQLYVTDDFIVTHNTIEAIAAMRVLLVRREIAAALVVAPAGLISQWRVELRRWAPELRVSTAHGAQADRHWQWRTPAHVYLTSYETLRVDLAESPHAPVARLWDLVVLDEAQRIKNASADVSRACKRLRRHRQWALTGTPLENSPDDLVSILEFVDPTSSRELTRFMLSAGLRQQLRRVQLRRRKEDVLPDLPPKLVSHIVLPLTPRQRESYQRAEREGVIELRAYGDRIETRNVLDLIGRLRQICNFCPVTGESSKLNDLRERLGLLAEEGHKALVFTQFASPAFGARAIAARLGSAAVVYTGDLTTEARDRALAQFRSDSARTALVLSVRAGGQGLNLQEASYVFHFDRWWNPAVVAQAEARSHRLGQRRPVNVYAYTAEQTIEERLERVLREKRLLFDELVDDVSLDVASALTHDELLSLFGLDSPAAASETAPVTDTAGGDAAALTARVQRALARHGWQCEPPRADGRAMDLRLVRAGEDGTETILLVRCLAQAAPADAGDVRDLAAALRGLPLGVARSLLVCPAGFTADAAALAADREVGLWDEGALRRLEV